MESVKESLVEMTELFNSRMNEFQKELKKASPAVVSTTSLASEFTSFKTFIVTALSTLQRQVEFLGREMDRAETRARRKMLLLHGVPEDDSEDTSSMVTRIVREKLNIGTFTSASISRCHRLGRPNDKKPRPVVVKFREAPLRDKVWFAKTKLKGTGITLSEFLTKTRHAVFMEARRRHGVKQCWTRDGLIHVLAADGSRHQVDSLVRLDAIPKATSPVQTTSDAQKQDRIASRHKRTQKK
ncbi:uncharacterized protein [Epargyreus clarus]|uniref:uncharacterized protein n=1 Tax=Epargyreus clarus TaxID=520877 RepID=UPI003C3096E2